MNATSIKSSEPLDAGDGPDTQVLFRAFADETRMRLLNLLLEGELCVCDLVRVLGVRQPNVSRHLSYLKRAGLVQDRQVGRWRYYALCENLDMARRALLNCVRGCLRSIDVLGDDLERLNQKTCQLEGCC